ncbi:Peptidase S1 domain and Peptidase S1A, chymotrypsin-type family and Trypsin-like cysteine/serine peptidase domain-containing protein [Strongyloides ratti]|uniref:Peptidase S1 domain and Peptidase S1A, chymotrypsin-type family and Trypsin-like cysteine/serine peptidase domain-containing protein n=1 Tax=Strongyloides ratti TaxID=34506 RepID=A0A090N0J1_STRRB|nr:Peptidase S1 domain and Peptidase S1A, chymotrypsin-type family and Trypsin-like cysteine/serine peptidase domain-containing protein [Strongyloides ratti]CEF70778.1 Peptidase S1 domain and Peptidase S1A, chymotrypsin-type family and Trypsin-like cysteine/serine peptidase domain-containing protein [Strongyloides ratti]
MFIKLIFIILIKILYGDDSIPVVHLFIKDQTENMDTSIGEGSCTGTILGGKYILTAAHCVFTANHCNDNLKNDFKNLSIPPKRLKIEYDTFCSHLRTACYENDEPKIARVNKIYVHKNYIENYCKEADLAILELQNDIGSKLMAVNSNKTFLPDKLLGFGFGDNPRNKQDSFKLQSDEFIITKCLHSKIPNGTFCTDESVSNFCKGDSGGPLMTVDRVIYGVVSGGTNCDYLENMLSKGKREIFKGNISYDVSNFLNFICSIIQQDKNNPVYGCEEYTDVLNNETEIFF